MLPFAKQWIDLAEHAKFINDMKQKAFVISFKSINVAESQSLIKPVLTVTLENKNPDQVPELASLKKLQQGQKKQELFYFRLSMLGKLKSKRRENYLNWELTEQSFENLAGQNKLREGTTRPYCSLRIANMNLDDYLCFSFEDSLAIFNDTHSEVF